MDFDKLIEKARRWLSDPAAREAVKSLLYVLVPLIVLSLLRSLKRAQTASKQAAAVIPRVRGTSTQSLVATETLQETMAKEKRKIERELQEVFGRRERLLTKTTTAEDARSDKPQPSPPSEPPGPSGEQALREDLIRVLLGRRRE
jgi:hypothetical protein